MNKKLMFVLKLVAMLAILGFVGWKLYQGWDDVQQKHLHVDWGFGALAVLTFAGTMVTSALVWRWLAWRMGDRNPTARLLGAYCFSQMGKYVPGKVMLLLMRIERAQRVGMDPQVCVVATLVENAMYMVSGGLVAVVTLLVFVKDQPWIAAVVGIGLLAMLSIFHPRVFYWLVNKALRKMKRPEVPQEKRLRKRELVAAVVMFLPVWVFGGVSLWCATRAVTMIEVGHILRLPGAYALGVTGGMASLLPGGVGSNDFLKTLFLIKPIGSAAALAAVGVQRLAQVIVEVVLGMIGAVMTSVGRGKGTGE